jgi:hypothetical protein
VIAVTGAIKAVTGAVTTVTRDSCAGRDRHRARRAHRGRSSLAESPGQRPGPPPLATPEQLAHETLARSKLLARAARAVLCCPAFGRVAIYVT